MPRSRNGRVSPRRLENAASPTNTNKRRSTLSPSSGFKSPLSKNEDIGPSKSLRARKKRELQEKLWQSPEPEAVVSAAGGPAGVYVLPELEDEFLQTSPTPSGSQEDSEAVESTGEDQPQQISGMEGDVDLDEKSVDGADVRMPLAGDTSSAGSSDSTPVSTDSTPVSTDSTPVSVSPVDELLANNDTSYSSDTNVKIKAVDDGKLFSKTIRYNPIPRLNVADKSVLKKKLSKKITEIVINVSSPSNDLPVDNGPVFPERGAKVEDSPTLKVDKSASRSKLKRGSRISDSEDSSVSTDSPLKPKTYTAIESRRSQRKRSIEKTSDVSTDELRPNLQLEAEVKLEKLSCSPEEEQPLFPKSYLEQKKKLETTTEINFNYANESEIVKAGERCIPKSEVAEDKSGDEVGVGESGGKVGVGKGRGEVAVKSWEEEEEDRREVDKRLKSFKPITENYYLCSRKISKQFRNMQCDCYMNKEDLEKGVKGCSDDCANRMLMIECGRDCPLDTMCSNKRFQNKENAPIEVFKTDWKGFGVRAMAAIPKDTFIMEYVGEALDHKQFRRRAKQYAKENVQHFYFMALSRDCYVDATNKGNISRFINHSCEPNSMTQKWMVNGENRVGFFTTKDVQPGEELNFDYKYERYGQVAQKCYCGTQGCRGWLGREPTLDSGIEEIEWTSSEEDEDEEEEQRQEESIKEEKKREEKERRRRRRKEKMKKYSEMEEWEEDIQRLSSTGIRNKLHTVELSRLMVRTTHVETRLLLTQLLLEGDQPCKRLFLDYQGLRIISHWMQDLGWSTPDLKLKLTIQTVLANMNIPHKTMLKDSKVYSGMEVWRVASPEASGNSSPWEQHHSIPSTPTHPSTPSASRPPSPAVQATPTPSVKSDPTVFPISDEGLFPPGEEPRPKQPQITDANPPYTEQSDQQKNSSELKQVNDEILYDEDEVVVVEESVRKPQRSEKGLDILKDLSAQAGVGGTNDEERGIIGDATVGPVAREEIPLSEKEDSERREMREKVKEVQSRAKQLLESWDQLQEMFKIPKKERHKIRVEHEREADCHNTAAAAAAAGGGVASHQGQAAPHPPGGQPAPPDQQLCALQAAARMYAQGNHQSQQQAGGARNSSWGRFYPEGKYQQPEKHRHSLASRDARNLRLDDKTGRLKQNGLLREDRRKLFAAKIEEEEKQKCLRSQLNARHARYCRLLGMDVSVTPWLNNYPTHYLSSGNKWVAVPVSPSPTPEPDWDPPSMAWLPLEAYRPDDPKPINPRDVYPPGICPPEPSPQPRVIPAPGQEANLAEVTEYYEDLYRKAPKSPVISPYISHLSSPMRFSEVAASPVPPDTSAHSTPKRRALPRSVQFLNSEPAEAPLFPREEAEEPAGADLGQELPPTMDTTSTEQNVPRATAAGESNGAEIRIRIPPKWRVAQDSQGRVYYYNIVSKAVEWEPPVDQENHHNDEGRGGGSNHSSSSSSSSSSSQQNGGQEGENSSGGKKSEVPVETLSSDDDEKDDDSDSEEDQKEEDVEDCEENEGEDGEIPPDQDLSASEKKMLLRMRNRNRLSKSERSSMRKLKRRKERQRRKEEREMIQARYIRHKDTGLVIEHCVPIRTEQDRADLTTFNEIKERLLNKDKIIQQIDKEIREDEKRERENERQELERRKRDHDKPKREKKSAAAARLKVSSSVADTTSIGHNQSVASDTSFSLNSSTVSVESSSSTTTAAADTSTDLEKKIQDAFVKEMSKVIVKVLDPYRKPGVKGYISSTEDFKYLAKKLTYTIMAKEREHCRNIEDLKANEKVKKKAAEYVKKKMNVYEREFKRSPKST